MEYPPNKFSHDRRPPEAPPQDGEDLANIRPGMKNAVKGITPTWNSQSYREGRDRFEAQDNDLAEIVPMFRKQPRRGENLVHFDIDPCNGGR
jgi:hypothetical protein